MRHVAFLRAINVGGHTVKMDRLRGLFESAGLTGVETFIASGNVLFDSRVKVTAPLELKIERHLEKALGYEVATFIRPLDTLPPLLGAHPFTTYERDEHPLHVGFLKGSLPAANLANLKALETPGDSFHCEGRELFWLRRGRFSDSKITGARIERALGGPVTFRNITSVRRLAEMVRA
jgi:uncharacterized protein (DUF1697 family)